MVRLLRYRSLTSLSSDSSNLRRAFSETTLQTSTLSDTSNTFLKVNQTQITVGEKVVVSWNIKEPTSDKDWIGLFYEDETVPENALDTRTRGIGRNKQGSVIWSIPKDLPFRSAINYCCFKYFYGTTGAVVATSQTLSIDVPLSLLPKRMPSLGNIGADSLLVVSISGLSAKDLKKGFFGKPNPYVRMCIVPRFRGLAVIHRYQGQQVKTVAQNGTVNPCWKNEVFVFHATPADFLEVEIRNKSGTKFSKFLGKISFPLCTIMDSCGYNKFRTVTQTLIGRNPSDKVQGAFTFTIFVRKSSVPKSEQEASGGKQSSRAQHKPIATSVSVPLDDMALPSGQHLETKTSKRPVSYHPSSSYQMRSATEPRNHNNQTTNYFASAAFRGQGQPTNAGVKSGRTRNSNSIQEPLEAVSSEDDSESLDDEEAEARRRDSSSSTTTEDSRAQDIDPMLTNGDVRGPRISEVVRHRSESSEPVEDNVENTNTRNGENAANVGDTGARNVTSLLRFTDSGPSFEEFIEQQNVSSNQSSSESSAEEEEAPPQDTTAETTTSPDASTMEANNTEETDEEGNSELVEEEGEDESDSESASGSEESSSESLDDGGDSAEHGYVEIEPGYVGDQSDTESQCSDVDNDEIYVGDDMPRDSIGSTVIGQGDLLNECLDILSTVGYPDIQVADRVADDESQQAEDCMPAEPVHSQGNEGTPDQERTAYSIDISDTRDFSSSSEATVGDNSSADNSVSADIAAEALTTHIAENLTEPSGTQIDNNNEIGNVLSVLDTITSHAESMLIDTGESDSVILSTVPGSEVKTTSTETVAEEQNSMVLITGKEGKTPDSSIKPPRGITRSRVAGREGDSQNQRNRSYHKAIFNFSHEDGSGKEKLSKQISSPGALWSSSSKKDGHSLETMLESVLSVSDGSPDLLKSAQNDGNSLLTEGSIQATHLPHAQASSRGAVSTSAIGTDVELSHTKAESTTTTENRFSSRHRILRNSESVDSYGCTPSAPNGTSRHRIADRTEVDPDLKPTTGRGAKLKYSVSDPLSKSMEAENQNRLAGHRDVRSRDGSRTKVKNALDVNSPIFRTDLLESSVDEVVTSSVAASTTQNKTDLGQGRSDIVTSSASVEFDTTRLKDGSVKSMRETAILSSSEDFSFSSSRNRPIARTDQPAALEEIKLPTAHVPYDSGHAAKGRDQRNKPLHRTEPMSDLSHSTPQSYAASTKPLLENSINRDRVIASETPCTNMEMGVVIGQPNTSTPKAAAPRVSERQPPPLPPRSSSIDHDDRPLATTAREFIIEEPILNPWNNVTLRNNRTPKTEKRTAAERAPLQSKEIIVSSKPEQVIRPDKVVLPRPFPQGGRDTSTVVTVTATRPSASATQSSASTGQPSASASATSSLFSDVPFDPTGATKPKIPDRLRAIKRTTPYVPFDSPPSVATTEEKRPHDENRSRGVSLNSNDKPRAPSIEHQARVRSESQPASPPANERTQPPAIPPRTDRDKHTSQGAKTRPPTSRPPPKHTPVTSSASVPVTSSSSTQPPPVTRKRTTVDAVSRSRRDEQSGKSRTPKSNQGKQVSSRSPAIIHSDAHTNGGNGSAERPRSQATHVDENGEILPSHWERAVDSHGRIYYIDHLTRATTWHRPKKGAQAANENDTTTAAQLQQQHLQQYDRRYQSLRRTIRGQRRGESNRPTILPPDSRPSEPEEHADRPRHLSRRHPPEISGNKQRNEPVQETTITDGPPGRAQPTLPEREGRVSFENTPGCKFVRRRDFFQFVRFHGMANQFLHRSTALKQMVNRIRADPTKYERYQHSRDFVTLLNFFVNTTAEMPAGWEKKSDQYGQTYFIDHSTRSTTFIDPRLPFEEAGPQNRPNPPSANATPEQSSSAKKPRRSTTPQQSTPVSTPSSRSQGATPTSTRQVQPVIAPPQTYNQRVVAFLKQTGIEDILKRKDPSLSSKNALRRKIAVIQRDGLRALDRLSNDIELVMLLSIFEDDIQSYVPPTLMRDVEMPRSPPEPKEQAVKDIPKDQQQQQRIPASRKPAPYRRDFEAKLRTFHRQMLQSGYGQGPGKIRMKIRRGHVVPDAFEQLMKQTPRALQRDRLYIKFIGEEGLDYGGPAREFFFLISRQCFDPYYGLFEYSASDTYTLQVSPVAARFVSNSHAWLRFCGRIIGLSLVHQHLLDVFFTRTIYKALLRQSYDLSDLESCDPEFHQSLSWILENDITDVLDMFFTTDEKVFDEVTERELKPGGKSIPVTEENKKEYVDLMIKWRMERGVGEQMTQLVNGFNEVLDLTMISIFDARELELVIAGTADIDVKDWRANTDYRSGYHDKHPVIQWFWKAVDSVNNEQRLRLLQFVTGTSSIPFEGFSALRGSTGPRKFTIDCWGDPKMLPRAHTCFNRLDLPPYRNFEDLHEKLLYAVEETSTFGIE